MQTKFTPGNRPRQADAPVPRRPHRRKRSRKRRRKARPRFGDVPLCFGRFAGRPLRNVPEGYLKWALRTKGVPETDRWLIEQYLKRNEGREAGRGGR